MDSLYHWLMNHQLVCSASSIILLFVLGFVNIEKVKMIGFTLSQYLRKFLGRKVEEKAESFVRAIDEGMHSDNTEDKK